MRKKVWEITQWVPRSGEEDREQVLPALGQILPCSWWRDDGDQPRTQSPCRTHARAKEQSLKGVRPQRDQAGAGETCEEESPAERSCPGLIATLHVCKVHLQCTKMVGILLQFVSWIIYSTVHFIPTPNTHTQLETHYLWLFALLSLWQAFIHCTKGCDCGAVQNGEEPAQSVLACPASEEQMPCSPSRRLSLYQKTPADF